MEDASKHTFKGVPILNVSDGALQIYALGSNLEITLVLSTIQSKWAMHPMQPAKSSILFSSLFQYAKKLSNFAGNHLM